MTKAKAEAPEPICIGCGTLARDLTDIDWAIDEEEEVTPEDRIEFIKHEEGTYNPVNGHFLCDTCYIKAGQPSSVTGWIAP